MERTHTQAPVVSVVLGTYNRLQSLKATINNVRRESSDVSHEIIAVDGGSTDGTINWLVSQKDVTVIVQHNRGTWRGTPLMKRSWGYFMNLGFKCAQGKFILMISDDCLLVHDSLRNGIKQFEEMTAAGRKVGAMAFYWRNWPEQEDYQVGLTLGNKMFVNHGLYLRAALAEVGWMEEDLFQFYHADGDVCLKLWQVGWEVVDCGNAFVEHCVHISRNTRQIGVLTQPTDWEAYLKRWSGVFYDPKIQNSGGRIHRSFQDPYNTAKDFPRSSFLLLLRRIRPTLAPSGDRRAFGMRRQI